MKYYIIALLLILVSSAYAIGVGDFPILNKGIRVGYSTGISPIGVETPSTYWFTSNTTYWDTSNSGLWGTTLDTEVP